MYASLMAARGPLVASAARANGIEGEPIIALTVEGEYAYAETVVVSLTVEQASELATLLEVALHADNAPSVSTEAFLQRHGKASARPASL